MSEKIPTNKLSIYLIKKEHVQHGDILTDIDELESEELKDIGKFYFKESQRFPPPWVKKFFAGSLKDHESLYNASSKAVLLVEIKVGKDKRIFVIAFGYGLYLLRTGVCEERFGLKTTLNIIDHESLRKINKKNMSIAPKDTSEQLTKEGVIANFGIDIEQDLIVSITGKSKNQNDFGKTVTGKTGLSVSVKRDLYSIKDFLEKCYKRYISDDYKKDFGWIDHIVEVKDVKIRDGLNNNMIKEFRRREDLVTTWMAVPDIIEWQDVKGFRYNKKKIEELKEDICIEDFLSSLSDEDEQKLDANFLKNKEVYCINADNEEVRYHWKVYDCIYSEITYEGKTFLLSNGQWYKIEEKFSDKIKLDYSGFRDTDCDIDLPEYSHKNEGAYNKAVPEEREGFYCMDQKIIQHGGGRGKIEFCDLITEEKELIHVKHYGVSSVLSHLFNQGFVSGELLLQDNEFREKVNKKLSKLSNRVEIKSPKDGFKASDYEIIFAIISSDKGDLEIPFFSKISLLNIKKRLESYGYKVFIKKISHQAN